MRHGPPKTTVRPGRASPKGRAVQRGPAAPRKAPPGAKAAKGAASPPAWSEPLSVFLTEPGAADLAFLELKHLKIVVRKARPTRLHLRNYDMLVLPGHLATPKNGVSRLCTNILRAPIFGKSAITARQLDELANLFTARGYRKLVSSVAGSKFNRPDLMRWLKTELGRRGVSLSESGRSIWLIVVDEFFYFSEEIQNYHDAPGRSEIAFRSGALPPTIAAAMAFAAQLKPGEIVWDPVAGSGNLLNEVFAQAPDAFGMATEIDPVAAAALEQRFAGRPRIWIAEADAATVALPMDGLSLTIANLPFGVRYKAAEGNPDFYAGVIANSLAHAGADWRGLFLTSDGAAMTEAARRHGLAPALVAELTVRGMKAGVWKLARGARPAA
jgi:hypothetical protein